jgi:hypothetical protein
VGKIFAAWQLTLQACPKQIMPTKPLSGLLRFESFWADLTWVVSVPAVLLTFWLPTLKRIAAWLSVILIPLPKKPDWWIKGIKLGGLLRITLLAGILLGALTSIRILGPLAGLLVILYFLLKTEPRPLAGLVPYAVVAGLTLFATWPYLWEAPLRNFIQVLQHMATTLARWFFSMRITSSKTRLSCICRSCC